MKDNFSAQAQQYSLFRPEYPDELYQYIFNRCYAYDHAWDCATGNGQIAFQLANKFDRVIATDLSEQQLLHARPHPRIKYKAATAEASGLPDKSCNLITVGQAIHWFDFDKFYREVHRVATKNCLLVVAGYGLPEINEPIDRELRHLYGHILKNYWDPERKYIDDDYQSIPFTGAELEVPRLFIRSQWDAEELAGYASTWSAVQHYIRKNGHDPVAGFKKRLLDIAGNHRFEVRFPVLLRVSRLK